jgi:preprotein translocase subunit SecA
MANVSNKVLERLFEIEIERPDQIAEMEREAEAKQHAELDQAVARHVGDSLPPPDPAEQLQAARQAAAQKVKKREEPKVGRNDLCPCGSGKKFKQCHGAAALAED